MKKKIRGAVREVSPPLVGKYVALVAREFGEGWAKSKYGQEHSRTKVLGRVQEFNPLEKKGDYRVRFMGDQAKYFYNRQQVETMLVGDDEEAGRLFATTGVLVVSYLICHPPPLPTLFLTPSRK